MVLYVYETTISKNTWIMQKIVVKFTSNFKLPHHTRFYFHSNSKLLLQKGNMHGGKNLRIFYSRICVEKKILHNLVSGLISNGFCIVNLTLFFMGNFENCKMSNKPYLGFGCNQDRRYTTPNASIKSWARN
jgi:hypothetical protein